MSHSGSREAAVFFDLDGTLLDTNYIHIMAWWATLAKAGQRVPAAVVHQHVGMGSTEFLAALVGEDHDGLKDLHDERFDEMRQLAAPLPGAADLIRAVKRTGAIVAVVTSATEREAPTLIGTLGVQDEIDVVVNGEDADRAKPHPDLFTQALTKTGLRPEHVVAIGDTVWDVKAAAGAGIGCIGVTTGGIDEDTLRRGGALAVYESCADLLEQWSSSPLPSLLG